MRKKKSLRWDGLYQNKGREKQKWPTPASEGLSAGENKERIKIRRSAVE